MAAVNPIQILIEAQNRAKAELDQARKQIDALAASAGNAGGSAKILQGNFADFGCGASAALSQVSPQAGALASRIESIAAVGTKLGPVAVAITAIGVAAAAAVVSGGKLADEIGRLRRSALGTGVTVNQFQALAKTV